MISFLGFMRSNYEIFNLEWKEACAGFVVFLPVHSETGRTVVAGYGLIIAIVTESNGCAFAVGRYLVYFYSRNRVAIAGFLANNGLIYLCIKFFTLAISSPYRKILIFA